MLASIFPAVFGLGHMAAMRYSLGAHLEGAWRRGDPPEPGRESALAAEVLEAVRASIARGVGEVETPGGQRVPYLILSGPGLPPAPAELPPYAEARSAPGCAVLG